MSAKLDTSKPLRLIGVQIFEGTTKEVRKNLSPGWYRFIKCKNDDEIGTSRDVYPLVAEDVCPQDYYTIDENLPRITISAIAGKNGSGKSSLIDIVYRIINNFAENTFLMKGVEETDEVGHAYGIEGRLHFEQDGVQKFIECNDVCTFYYELVDGNPEEIKIHNLTEKQRDDVLNGFFYTISINYSLYAFNPSDYGTPFDPKSSERYNGKWLNHLFHKNDGYYIPIVLTPFRENGQIDVNNENSLAKQRIEVLSLLFHSQKEEFLDEYVPTHLKYMFNGRYKVNKQQRLLDNPIKSEIKDSQDLLISQIEELWKKYLIDNFGLELEQSDSQRDEVALYYLAYKTLKICATYSVFREISKFDQLMALKETKMVEDRKGNLQPVLNNDGSEQMIVTGENVRKWYKGHIEDLKVAIANIVNQPCNHITVKIHQCLDYLKEGRFANNEDSLDVDSSLLKGKRYELYDEMMRQLPPSFFITELCYKRKGQPQTNSDDEEEITLQSMSSGERQMLYSLSYIYYHIKNIASIKGENGKRVVGYHHINLIFDEAELYYHPEYQRQYVKRLLERMAMCHINRTNIRSINIVIITHSPFILSDIPESNILFLHRGDELAETEPGHTLGANVYDLLRNGFFLDYAIGDLVQMKLQEIMDVYYMKKDEEEEQRSKFIKKKVEFKFTIDHLGEEYLHRNFLRMYEELELKEEGISRKAQIKNKIGKLQKEIDDLNAQMTNL
jgi:hypothetical protein